MMTKARRRTKMKDLQDDQRSFAWLQRKRRGYSSNRLPKQKVVGRSVGFLLRYITLLHPRLHSTVQLPHPVDPPILPPLASIITCLFPFPFPPLVFTLCRRLSSFLVVVLPSCSYPAVHCIFPPIFLSFLSLFPLYTFLRSTLSCFDVFLRMSFSLPFPTSHALLLQALVVLFLVVSIPPNPCIYLLYD